MPYISVERRKDIDQNINKLIESIRNLSSPDIRDLDGDLNYCITKIILHVLDIIEQPKYTKFNTAVGVLESVKLELYRRVISPYEDNKIRENGDVV